MKIPKLRRNLFLHTTFPFFRVFVSFVTLLSIKMDLRNISYLWQNYPS